MRKALITLAVLTAALGCSGESDSHGEGDANQPVMLGEYVSADSLPHIRYFEDGRVSLNDRCPVRKVKLNRRMPPVYVNGRPVGFC